MSGNLIHLFQNPTKPKIECHGGREMMRPQLILRKPGHTNNCSVTGAKILSLHTPYLNPRFLGRDNPVLALSPWAEADDK